MTVTKARRVPHPVAIPTYKKPEREAMLEAIQRGRRWAAGGIQFTPGLDPNDILADLFVKLGAELIPALLESFQTGVQIEEGNSAALWGSIFAAIGDRITGINNTTRAAVMDEITEGMDQGEGMAAIGDRIEDLAATVFSEYRGELIARTEANRALNLAQIQAYSAYGVERVVAIDGDEWDDVCAARNGKVYDAADAIAIEDHPNGTLDWSPVIGNEVITPPSDIGEISPTPEHLPPGQTATASATLDPNAIANALNLGETVMVNAEDIPALMDAFAKRTDDPDLSNIRVNGTLLYGYNGLGIPRDQMPQIPDELRESFFQQLAAQGVSADFRYINPQDYQPSQSELSARRVAQMYDGMTVNGPGGQQIIVTSDGYVLDGHHHWAAATTLGFTQDGVTIPAWVVNMPIADAIAYANQFDVDHGIVHQNIHNDATPAAPGTFQAAADPSLSGFKYNPQSFATEAEQRDMYDRKEFELWAASLPNGSADLAMNTMDPDLADGIKDAVNHEFQEYGPVWDDAMQRFHMTTYKTQVPDYVANDEGTFAATRTSNVTALPETNGRQLVGVDMYLNPDLWSNEKAFYEHLKEAHEKGWMVSDTPEYVIDHEFGHIFDGIAGEHGKDFTEGAAWYNARVKSDPPSQYGAWGDGEWFAEAWARANIDPKWAKENPAGQLILKIQDDLKHGRNPDFGDLPLTPEEKEARDNI